MTKLSLLTLAACTLCSVSAHAAPVTFAAIGGDFQEDLVRAIVEPAAAATNNEFRQDTHTYLPGIRLQVQSGNPAWDIVHLGCHLTAAGEKEDLFETITTAGQYPSTIPTEFVSEKWVGTNYYSTVLAYRTDVYGDNPPQTWADFWNTEKFPGRRALSASPQEMLEIALLADGVAKEDVYPIDTDRAFESLRKIKPSVDIWWTTGGQATQLLIDNEVDMIATWTSRVEAALIENAPVDFTFNEGIIASACVAIPKGSQNVEASSEMILQMLQPEVQSNIATELAYYGAINPVAYEAEISAEQLALSNASPENAAVQLKSDPRWWSENIGKMNELYQAMINE